jgi:hypothetical protein
MISRKYPKSTTKNTILIQALLQRVLLPAESDAADLKKFYTAMYHASTCPTRYDEQDGAYRKFDQTEATYTAGTHYYRSFLDLDGFFIFNGFFVFDGFFVLDGFFVFDGFFVLDGFFC